MDEEKPANIFLVERDTAVRESLIWLLEALGFRVEAFASISDFSAAFDGRPGCLVVDVGYQGGEGAKVADALRGHEGELPVIAISADPSMSPDDVARSGAQRFLPKPFTSDDLLRCIDELMQRSHRDDDSSDRS